MKRVVVATHNEHKVSEIRAILDMPEWEFVSLSELGINEEPVEDADSFVGNARIKAQFAHALTGLAALADDSGLVVDALEGAPGVYSSRYAGETADDRANNAKLLQELEEVVADNPDERTAHFVCSLCFIDTDGAEALAQGDVAGRITYEPRGCHGFGYDPLFEVAALDFKYTMAELKSSEKNVLSHRSKALENLKETLNAQDDGASAIPSEQPVILSNTPCHSERSEEPFTPQKDDKVEIVAFDFDGTLIDASSPVKLIRRLNRDKIMGKWAIAKSIFWGMRYKMGWELDQTQPRRYVFSSFKDFPASDADAIMQDLYTEDLRPCLRPSMLKLLEEHKKAGREVIVVSASFEPIIKACCKDLEIEDYICTQMEIKDGVYTGEIAGVPPEGEQKLIQLKAWADKTYGPEGWVLSHAYGDHFSDVPLMEIAQYPIAVDPDRRLGRIAKGHGWVAYPS